MGPMVMFFDGQHPLAASGGDPVSASLAGPADFHSEEQVMTVGTEGTETPETGSVVLDQDVPAGLKAPSDGVYQIQTGVLIGPDEADYLISLNAANNRNLKEHKVTLFTRDMVKGLWLGETGESIKVDTDGRMIDGNHRVHAVARSGKTLLFDIAWNLKPNRILVIDSGTPRSSADDFRVMNVADRFKASALVRWAVSWERGNYVNSGGRLRATKSEIYTRYMQDPESFDDASLYGRGLRQAVGAVNPSTACMAYWIFAQLDRDLAKDMFERMITGEGENSDPAKALRNRLIRSDSRGLDRNKQLVLFIKAWNALRDPRKASPTGRYLIPEPLVNANFPQPV